MTWMRRAVAAAGLSEPAVELRDRRHPEAQPTSGPASSHAAASPPAARAAAARRGAATSTSEGRPCGERRVSADVQPAARSQRPPVPPWWRAASSRKAACCGAGRGRRGWSSGHAGVLSGRRPAAARWRLSPSRAASCSTSTAKEAAVLRRPRSGKAETRHNRASGVSGSGHETECRTRGISQRMGAHALPLRGARTAQLRPLHRVRGCKAQQEAPHARQLGCELLQAQRGNLRPTERSAHACARTAARA